MELRYALVLDNPVPPIPELISLTGNEFQLGRSKQSSCVIEQVNISRTHCVFQKINNEWFLTDKSMNGILLNGSMMDRTCSHRLREGDCIGLTDKISFTFTKQDTDDPQIDGTPQGCLPYETEEVAVPSIVSVAKPETAENSNTTENTANDTHLGGSALATHSDDSVSAACSGNSASVGSSENVTAAVASTSTAKDTNINLDHVEDELQCAICTEMFIKAATLSCSHTFCMYCIEQWRRSHNKCPICRKNITTICPTLVVDNFIEKVLETAGDEVKERRIKVIEGRASSVTAQSSKITSEPIEVTSGEDSNYEDDMWTSDDSNMSSDWDIDHDMDAYEDYNGLPGKYYGGYGHCYKCGERGHWANGCPNRSRH